jgi:hypothetical protein
MFGSRATANTPTKCGVQPILEQIRRNFLGQLLTPIPERLPIFSVIEAHS